MRSVLRLTALAAITLTLPVRAYAAGDLPQLNTVLNGPVQSLPYGVKDAEFSTALNVIVSVSESPAQLHLYDPDTTLASYVNLPLNPTCVSVSPDGLRAAVGHNAWISEVDLSTSTVVKTIAVAANVTEIVHGGNGYAYVFSTDANVRSIHLATEAVTTTYSWRNPAVARLHPARDRIYGADRNVSPSDIVRINIAGGPAQQGVDSVYHGDYSFCGDIWISADGLRLITACGNAFRASNDPLADMRFNGKLSQEQRITSAAFSRTGNSIAVLPAYTGSLPRTDNEIHYYSHDVLQYRGKAVLPSFATETNSWASRGRWIFFNAAENRQYVVVQADAASGIINDFGVVTIDCATASVSLTPSSATISAAPQTVQIDVTGVTGCPWTTASTASWVEPTSSGAGNGAVTLNVAANESVSSRTATVTIGNATFTLTQNAPDGPVPLPARRTTALPFRVVDAEYSKSLDAIVAVSESPYRLVIYRPTTRSLLSVALGAAPLCVSVGPDGKFAAVGHDGTISYVDLENALLVKTLDVSANVLDIVLAGNGYVYAFPRVDQWETIRSVHISSNLETQSTGRSIYAGTLGRLHPGSTWMYGANNGLSPADIEKYDISAGTAVYKYDSPYHGDYPMCGNLWFSEDGARIYTACGNVFRSTAIESTDMTYAGKLEGESSIRWASNSQAAGSIAILPSYGAYWWQPSAPRSDHEVHYYTPDFLVYRGKYVLPPFVVENTSWPSRGRWHFFDATGTRQYVVVQSDSDSGMLYDFGVVMIDCANAAVSLDSAGTSIGANGGNLQTAVTGTEGCGWKAVSDVSWINTLSSGVGNGTVHMTVSQNSSASPRSGTVTVGGATFTIQQAGVTPTSVVATATSPTSVTVTWTSPAADRFEVWRVSPAGGALLASPTTLSFTDTTASPGSAYIYKVRAVFADGSITAFRSDYAHTYTLIDPSLTGLLIRAVHVTEPRAIVSALRSAAGMAAVTFTDESLAGMVAKRVHMTELRTAVDELRSLLGLAPFGFTALAPNSVIRASTTEEIRAALR